MSNFLKKLKREVICLFFPNRCAVCNRVVDSSIRYCCDCEEKLHRVPPYIAEICSFTGNNLMRTSQKAAFDGYAAPFFHEAGGRELIYNFKFHNRSELKEVLADEMADSFRKYLSEHSFDFICGVPFTFSGKLRRGYDQVDLLCRELSKRLSIPYERLLKQVRRKKPQHTLRAHGRFLNVKGIYALRKGVNIKEKTILLVDDIITTGATVNECARVLKRNGAKAVYCLLSTINH